MINMHGHQSGIPHPVSGTQHPVSSIWFAVSFIQYPVSGIQESSIHHAVPNLFNPRQRVCVIDVDMLMIFRKAHFLSKPRSDGLKIPEAKAFDPRSKAQNILGAMVWHRLMVAPSKYCMIDLEPEVNVSKILKLTREGFQYNGARMSEDRINFVWNEEVSREILKQNKEEEERKKKEAEKRKVEREKKKKEKEREQKKQEAMLKFVKEAKKAAAKKARAKAAEAKAKAAKAKALAKKPASKGKKK